MRKSIYDEVTSGEEFAEKLVIPALEFAIKLMTQHPSSECLKQLEVLRALRKGIYKVTVTEEKVEDEMPSSELAELTERYEKADARITEVADASGVPKDVVEEAVMEHIEARMKTAGIDPTRLKQKVTRLMRAGNVAEAMALMRDAGEKMRAKHGEEP